MNGPTDQLISSVRLNCNGINCLLSYRELVGISEEGMTYDSRMPP
jgi:hypothetical protein